jgi:DNA-binding SARP family transcriptional activator
MSEIRLINGFEIECRGAGHLSAGSQRLLAFLAVGSGPLQRSYVAGSLWPDTSEDRAKANLRTALWQLGRSGPRLVASSRSHLHLVVGVSVDLHDAAAAAHRVLRDPDSASLADCRLPGLRGDLLPDWYDEWLISTRERFLDLRLHALEAACRRLGRLGHVGEAVEAGRAAVGAEPLRESSNRVLVETYIANGNVAAAIRQFTVYRRALRREIGVEPSHLMLSMIGAIQSRVARVEREEVAS